MASTVTIEKLVYGGDGLGRIDGQVVLAPFVLPGEQVTLETVRGKSGLLRGSSAEILESSPHRAPPRCEYFGDCGGCHYQHADYPYQVLQKVEILRETLRRLGGIDFEGEIPAVSGAPWFYRNRVQLHFDGQQSGFHKRSSRVIRSIDHCYIAAPDLVEAIARFRENVRLPEWPGFLRSLELFTNGAEMQINVLDSTRPVAARFFEWCAAFLPTLVPGELFYNAAGCRFRISGGSFFQVNRFLVDALVDEVLSDSEGKSAVDLYAGVGLFSLPIAKRFAQVRAVERSGSAFRDLLFNAAQASASIRSIQGAAETYIGESGLEKPDLLVADPPRTGLGQEAIAAISNLKPARITLVSCDPATLARDARQLLKDYRIRRLALLDLFPQTYHFETVMHLEAIHA